MSSIINDFALKKSRKHNVYKTSAESEDSNDNLYTCIYADIVHMFYFTVLIVYFRLVVIILILINFIKCQFKYYNI